MYHWYMNQTCSTCDESKPIESFGIRAGTKRKTQCKACANTVAKRSRDKLYRENKPEAQARYWKRNLLRFHLTPEKWQEIYDRQGGVCMYCGEPETSVLKGVVKRMAVDHDHNCCPGVSNSCGECIRGLSCSKCNQLAGTLERNAERVRIIQTTLGLI